MTYACVLWPLYVYIYIWSPPPYDPPMCHLYCYLQHKMRIFSIPFLFSSYIVITIQYLKALWGRPHRNTIDRRPKIKKTSGKQKTKQKKKQYFPTPLGSLHEKNKKTLRKPKKKKQYFQTLLGSLHEKTKKTLRKPKKTKKTKKTIFSDSSGVTPWKNQKKHWENQKKKTIFSDSSGVTPWKNQKNLEKTKKTKKKQKKQYLETISRAPPKESLNIVFFVFFCFLVFSRFFWFFHGVTPEESENIVFLIFLVFFVFSRFFGFFTEWPQKIIRIWKLIISPIFLKCKHCLSLMHLPIRNWTVSNPNYCLDLSVIHASVQLQLSHFNSKLLPGSSHLLLRFF